MFQKSERRCFSFLCLHMGDVLKKNDVNQSIFDLLFRKTKCAPNNLNKIVSSTYTYTYAFKRKNVKRKFFWFFLYNFMTLPLCKHKIKKTPIFGFWNIPKLHYFSYLEGAVFSNLNMHIT